MYKEENLWMSQTVKLVSKALWLYLFDVNLHWKWNNEECMCVKYVLFQNTSIRKRKGGRVLIHCPILTFLKHLNLTPQIIIEKRASWNKPLTHRDPSTSPGTKVPKFAFKQAESPCDHSQPAGIPHSDFQVFDDDSVDICVTSTFH